MWAKQIKFQHSPQCVRFVDGDVEVMPAHPEHDTQHEIQPPNDAAETPDPSVETADHRIGEHISKMACDRVCIELEKIKAQQQQWLLDLQHVAIEIATQVCRRLLSDCISAGNQDIQALVRQAVSHFEQTAALRVRLHPEDWKSVAKVNPEFAASPQLSFVEDEQITRGNCRVESSEYDLVFDWQAKLEDMRCALLQGVNDARNES